MGLLNYQKPQGEAYLDYYKNYRGPSYNWKWATQTTAPIQTAAQAGLLSSTASPAAMDSGGEGFGSTNAGIDGKLGTTESAESVGSMGVNNGRGTLAGIAAMGLNAAVPGLSAVSTVSGLLGGPTTKDVAKAAVDAFYGSPDKYNGLDFDRDAETAARAQMDQQARENDANRGFSDYGGFIGGYDGMPSETSYGDLAGLGGYGGYGGPDSDGTNGNGPNGANGTNGSGTGPGANGGEDGGASDGNGWRRGGPIKPRRGLLDHADDSMQNATPFRGLLSGPITTERDNIPAVNKSTGEKIAVESGEFVMTRKAVKKKGKKFFDKINEDAENDD